MPFKKRTTGFKRKRAYGRKSYRKPTRYARRRPKRVIRRAVRSRAISRVPRLVSDLQYGAKRPPVFKTTYSDMRTFRVTPQHTTAGTGSPATMFVNLSDLGGLDIFNATNGFWKPLQFSSRPELFERIGRYYEGYHVIGAKLSATIKPLLGNTNAHDGHNLAGEPTVNDEGIILATVGLTDHRGFPDSLTTPDMLTKYPRARSHTSIYKRQEAQIGHDTVPGIAGTVLQAVAGGGVAPVANPLAGQAVAMVPGERGKQLSFQTKYSPKRLYGQKATTNGYLRVHMDQLGHGQVNAQQAQYAFVDIREFECAPENLILDAQHRDWTMTPDCIVTIRVDYIIQVSDPKGIGGVLLDSRTALINSGETRETDAPLQDGGGGDMDVPDPGPGN